MWPPLRSVARLSQSTVELKLQRLDHEVGLEVFFLVARGAPGFARELHFSDAALECVVVFLKCHAGGAAKIEKRIHRPYAR